MHSVRRWAKQSGAAAEQQAAPPVLQSSREEEKREMRKQKARNPSQSRVSTSCSVGSECAIDAPPPAKGGVSSCSRKVFGCANTSARAAAAAAAEAALLTANLAVGALLSPTRWTTRPDGSRRAGRGWPAGCLSTDVSFSTATLNDVGLFGGSLVLARY